MRLRRANKIRFTNGDPWGDWQDFLRAGDGLNPFLLEWAEFRQMDGQGMALDVLQAVAEECLPEAREEWAMWEDELRHEEYLWNNR